jgi:hypothetical protein
MRWSLALWGQGPKKERGGEFAQFGTLPFSQGQYICASYHYMYYTISEGIFSVFIGQVTFSNHAYKTSLRAEDKKL